MFFYGNPRVYVVTLTTFIIIMFPTCFQLHYRYIYYHFIPLIKWTLNDINAGVSLSFCAAGQWGFSPGIFSSSYKRKYKEKKKTTGQSHG